MAYLYCVSAWESITKTNACLVLATGIEKPSLKVSFSMYCIVKVYYSTKLACKLLLEFTGVERFTYPQCMRIGIQSY